MPLHTFALVKQAHAKSHHNFNIASHSAYLHQVPFTSLQFHFVPVLHQQHFSFSLLVLVEHSFSYLRKQHDLKWNIPQCARRFVH